MKILDRQETKLKRSYKIAVAGIGYVGLSISILLAQANRVVAVDVAEEKVNMINRKKSPIHDDYIEDYLANKDLDLVASLDTDMAYRDADYVVIAAPTNYDAQKNICHRGGYRKSFAGKPGGHYSNQVYYTGWLYRIGQGQV